jgi:competence protein ComEA
MLKWLSHWGLGMALSCIHRSLPRAPASELKPRPASEQERSKEPRHEHGRGRTAAPAVPALARTLANWQRSAWAPVITKALGVAAILLGLAALGSHSLATPPTAGPAASVSAALLPASNTWLNDGASMPSTADPTSAAVPAQLEGLPRTPLSPIAAPTQLANTLCEQAPTQPSGITSDGKVILNTASAEELTKLPGVGPKRAQSIVSLRQRLKRFKSLNDLLRVRGIGVRSLKKMLPHLVLDAPKPQAPQTPAAEATPPF